MVDSLAAVRAWLIDLDGVIYRGNVPLPGAADFISWLRARGLAFRLVTNNATLTPQQFVDKMAAMDIAVTPAEVFTSSLATALFLQRQGAAGQKAYVVGEDGLRQALSAAGMVLTDDHPQWVIAGLDRALTYDKLATAAVAIRAGARFIGTNPDVTLPTERGLLPGAGSILAALGAATDVQPTVIGKPQPLMLQLAMEQLGVGPEETVMLGDRLDTDIGAAAAAHIRSILVLTGVSTREDLAGSEWHPDLVVSGLPELMRAWPESVAAS